MYKIASFTQCWIITNIFPHLNWKTEITKKQFFSESTEIAGVVTIGPFSNERMFACAVTLCIINSYDTTWATYVQVFFTASKLIAVGIIIIGGFVRLGQGETNRRTVKPGYKELAYKELPVIRNRFSFPNVYQWTSSFYVYKKLRFNEHMFMVDEIIPLCGVVQLRNTRRYIETNVCRPDELFKSGFYWCQCLMSA